MSPGRAESNALLREWCPEITGVVLSLGSSSDSDGDGRSYRDYFTKATRYYTSEPEPDDRCDLVVDIRDLSSLTIRVDALFCSGVLEHVDDVFRAVEQCFSVLNTGGVLLAGVPFWQPIHRAPQDFWRFTEFGVRYLLRAFQVLELRAIGDPKQPSAYWVKAVKP